MAAFTAGCSTASVSSRRWRTSDSRRADAAPCCSARAAQAPHLGDRASTLAGKLSGRFATTRVETAGADPAGFDLVVNATPLGLEPDDPLPLDVSRLDDHCTVVDILMKNQPTPLLRACRARGINAHPGFEMLVQQVPDYLDFFGLHDVAQAVREDLSETRALIGAQ